MNNRIKVKSISPAIELRCSIRKLKQKADMLKRLRFIRNEILSNCAYHEANIERQLQRFEALRVPKYEVDIIVKSGEISNYIAKGMLKEYEELLDELEEIYM